MGNHRQPGSVSNSRCVKIASQGMRKAAGIGKSGSGKSGSGKAGTGKAGSGAGKRNNPSASYFLQNKRQQRLRKGQS